MSRLELLSTAVQVVVVTDDVTLTSWADQLGPDRASLVDLST